ASPTSPGPITIAPGQSWTLASTANGGQAQWLVAFGPSVAPFWTTAFMGNGDDVYSLENGTTVIDRFGIPGAADRPAVGQTWNYQDSFARRKPNVCTPSATFNISQWILPGSDWAEIPNQNGNATANNSLWTNNTGYMISPNVHQNICAGRVNDCNGNGIEDFAEITATPSLDVDRNGVPDACDVQFGFASDCNGDLHPDNGQIEAGTFPDTNGNGIPDGCEGLLFDCNGNFIEDATDILNGTETDCNGNNRPDSCEIRTGGLTDANANTVPDACAPDNAFVGETTVNATVNAAGIRSGPNGDAFFNIEGPDQVNLPPTPNGEFRSYGGLRFPIAPIATKFDTAFGAGQWEVTEAYLVLVQSNAGFTANGDVVAYHSNNDAISFANGDTATLFDSFAADFADRQAAATWTFTQTSNGFVESHKLFDVTVSGNAGGDAIASEIESGAGNLTLALKNSDTTTTVAATYAGFSNNLYAGPTLVVFARAASGPACAWRADGCFSDYNNDGGIDGDDVIAFFADWDAGLDCGDVDASTGVDGDDVIIFFAAWDAGGIGFPGCQ
ncbi:MAG: hypothetical protein ACOYN0_11535, partial [Phycisphaerales bacterium]